MRIPTTVCLLLAAACSPHPVGPAVHSADAIDTTGLQASIDALEARCAHLEAELHTVRADRSMRSTLASLERDVVHHQARIEQLSGEDRALRSWVAGNYSDATSVAAQIDAAAAAQGATLDALHTAVAELEADVGLNIRDIATLDTTVTDHGEAVATLDLARAELEAHIEGVANDLQTVDDDISDIDEDLGELTDVLSRDAQGDLVLTGVNLRLVNGTGSSTITNGTGNLIIGYDQDFAERMLRSGSHNVVIGDEHEYTGSNGLVSGYDNALTGRYSAIVGGTSNSVAADGAAAVAGAANTVQGAYGATLGGEQLVITDAYTTASGPTPLLFEVAAPL